jgi:methylmalonyl-CoA mutase
VLDVPPILVPTAPASISIEPLPSIRLAEPYEKLREAADRMLARKGSRPKIFLANLGSPADFTARSTFARNLFEAGGIEAVTNDGFAGLDGMTAAFKASGATLACLCSSDTVYEREAAASAKALTAAGARHIYLAGRPRKLEETLKAAAVQDFVYAGCDALATLAAVHDRLNLK